MTKLYFFLFQKVFNDDHRNIQGMFQSCIMQVTLSQQRRPSHASSTAFLYFIAHMEYIVNLLRLQHMEYIVSDGLVKIHDLLMQLHV